MNLQELTDEAVKRGRADGADAADWYFDEGRSDVTRADYQRVLAGIENGDPRVMDTLPCADLSGQMADSLTPMKLYDELGVSELQLRNWESDGELDVLLTAYEDSYSQAAADAIEQHCHSMLEQDVTFTISVMTEQDPEQLMMKLVDLLARENCDLDEESFEVI